MDTLKTEGPSDKESEFIFKTYELVEGKLVILIREGKFLAFFLFPQLLN